MKPYEVLDAAADLIDRCGHCKGSQEQGGAHCALGAIFEVQGFSIPHHPTFREAGVPELEAAVGPASFSVHGIAPWNNQPGRTKDEVTSTMRAVAATLRMREERLLPVCVSEKSHVPPTSVLSRVAS